MNVVVVGLFIILSVYPTIRHGLIVRYIISMIAFIVQKKTDIDFPQSVRVALITTFNVYINLNVRFFFVLM